MKFFDPVFVSKRYHSLYKINVSRINRYAARPLSFKVSYFFYTVASDQTGSLLICIPIQQYRSRPSQHEQSYFLYFIISHQNRFVNTFFTNYNAKKTVLFNCKTHNKLYDNSFFLKLLHDCIFLFSLFILFALFVKCNIMPIY